MADLSEFHFQSLFIRIERFYIDLEEIYISYFTLQKSFSISSILAIFSLGVLWRITRQAGRELAQRLATADHFKSFASINLTKKC